ncbi:prephenate dehydrogenase [Clostridium polyendosporum]|uniref:Prephenate dehydrogenase n=1 Tax=Clostridium polyendosporum TaxID=69208 RepID=A0A919S062_9CLOT|nr:prephenate dehydrogenase [Clostridium polyendosporum]GIM29526.1 prephenate dehydrogenase [Clostridium polyendosporum]
MDDNGFSFNIAVVGLGLIGGSYAKALRELKPKKLYGIDLNESSLLKAKKMGIIDEGFTDGSVILKEADLVIIALYPEDTVKFIKDNVCNFKDGAVITDTCGVKQMIVEEALSFLPETVEFVGAHPMAGKESQGFDTASKDLFKNSNYIITPHKENSEKSINLIEKMAKAIGCKSVVRVDIEEHDNIISYTSQLPHVIAVALMDSDICKDAIDLFIGGSFRDATRVAAINEKLWTQLFSLNSDRLVYEIEKFQEALNKIKRAIKSQDKSDLEDIFKDAAQRKRMML